MLLRCALPLRASSYQSRSVNTSAGAVKQCGPCGPGRPAGRVASGQSARAPLPCEHARFLPSSGTAPGALRAVMAESGEEVTLYMYDLTHGVAAALSQQLLGRHIEAVWHTSVVLHGREHYYGGGVQSAPPGRTHFGPPLRTLPLGRTHVTREALRDSLRQLGATRFTATSYDLIANNCNNFSDCLCQLLGVRGVPDDILDLPRLVLESPAGAMLRPMLQPLSAALAVTEEEPAAAAPSLLPLPLLSPPPEAAAADAADGEAAFEAAVRSEFAALVAAGAGAGEAAEQAVTRVLARQGLA